MPRQPAPRGRTGRPPRTSRARILAAARELIDRDGWEALTVRRLAAELGVGATTLYHHVRNREELLVLLLSEHLGRMERPALPDDPRDRIVAGAVAMRDAAAAWPFVAEVVTTDGFVGLIDEDALWMVEAIVAGAEDCGCTPAQAVYLFRSVYYYTVGEVLVRANTASRRAGDLPPARLGDLDAAKVPRLAAIGDVWPETAARDTYARGLAAFVDGLLAQITSTGL
ncbi:TetR/AcrR family transcriptional regulator [Actinomadura chibensis]|uniref:Helix-turn-helix transcriptional regulator n=1 Tax=Actinomadura chibensis TaxID=392828 RepID=A0A5D0NZD2_9ACTN|nr:helix-turn-helix domain-containing protein [Actinomadura chibensis]TYB49702.1 helix-turn-helix transcriptional regulator [Actinomadura chibensis]